MAVSSVSVAETVSVSDRGGVDDGSGNLGDDGSGVDNGSNVLSDGGVGRDDGSVRLGDDGGVSVSVSEDGSGSVTVTVSDSGSGSVTVTVSDGGSGSVTVTDGSGLSGGDEGGESEGLRRNKVLEAANSLFSSLSEDFRVCRKNYSRRSFCSSLDLSCSLMSETSIFIRKGEGWEGGNPGDVRVGSSLGLPAR